MKLTYRLFEVLFSAVCLSLLVVPVKLAIADAQSKRIGIEYELPKNPAHQSLYEMLKERRVLEKLQEIFSPFQLPIELTFKTVGCDGVSNAWYSRPTVSICYEYLAEIQRDMPKETTSAGVTPADAVLGQFFYAVAHETGHAMFDLLNVPNLWAPRGCRRSICRIHHSRNSARPMRVVSFWAPRTPIAST